MVQTRTRYAPETKDALLVAFRTSGLQPKDFAVRNDIKLPTLYSWLRSPKRAAEVTLQHPDERAPIHFLTLQTARPSENHSVEIQFGQASARVPLHAGPDFVAAVLKNLRA